MENSRNQNKVVERQEITRKIPFVPSTNERHLKLGQWRELFYHVYEPESSQELNPITIIHKK